MEIKRIVPNISSMKFEESRKFYTDFLGLKLAMDMNWIMTFISESNPLAQITIVKKEKLPIINSDLTITIEVSDIELIYDKAKEFNYEIIYPITSESWGVRRFFIKDPNGVTINLMCHINK